MTSRPNEQRDSHARALDAYREALKLGREMFEEDISKTNDRITELGKRLDLLEDQVFRRPDSLVVAVARNDQRDDHQDHLHVSYQDKMADLQEKNNDSGTFGAMKWIWGRSGDKGAIRAALLIVFIIWATVFDGCNNLIDTIGEVATGISSAQEERGLGHIPRDPLLDDPYRPQERGGEGNPSEETPQGSYGYE